MGFFKNIFKKKKGGTLVGNLIRGAASHYTGGILGSGVGLANWEAEQAQNEQEKKILEYKANQIKFETQKKANALIQRQLREQELSTDKPKSEDFFGKIKKYWYIPTAVISLPLFLWVILKSTKKSSR